MVLLLCFTQVLQAQNSNSKFFNEGSGPKRVNLLKLELGYLMNRDIGVFYERIINWNFGVEIGASYLLNGFEPGVLILDGDDDNLDRQSQSGFSWYIHPRYYLSRSAPDDFFVGLQYRGRSLDIVGEGFSQNSYSLTLGLQEETRYKIVWETFGGIGLHSEKGTDAGSTFKNTNGLAITGGLRIAYYF